MKKIKFIFSGIVFLGLMLLFIPAFSQTPPASQTAGGITRQEKEIQRSRSLEERVKKERIKPEDETSAPAEECIKIPIQKIIIEGKPAISKAELKKITSSFEGKDLSLKDMQKIADLITEAHRKEGFSSLVAYLPLQTIKDDILVIKVEKEAE